jgi:hypothetical protein
MKKEAEEEEEEINDRAKGRVIIILAMFVNMLNSHIRRSSIIIKHKEKIMKITVLGIYLLLLRMVIMVIGRKFSHSR